MPLALQDRAIVRDAIVRARLGLTLPEERASSTSSPPPLLARMEPSAKGGSARSSESVKPHCIYCGHRTRAASVACGSHADLLELDKDESDA